ncbi:MAG TPA: Rieske (2Fe-2S) protein [Candidatus Dormibacteraeota bacterium]|jgi:nitrite reductase/ring-hydroxylating ferredoxin subunit
MNRKPENRVDKIVTELLRGRRLKLRGGDAEEKAAITAAARLAGARQGSQRMHPSFRKRLAEELDHAQHRGWVTRRTALVAGLGLAAGAAGGVLLGRSGAPEQVQAETIEPVDGRWVDVGALHDFREGEGQRVVAGGVGAYVFRRGETVSAVSSICSHLPCELSWDGAAGHLLCPCHPARFSPAGEPKVRYPLPALSKVHVRVTEQGRVEVLGTA